MKTLLALPLLLAAGLAGAESRTLPVPDQDWSLTFDTPPLVERSSPDPAMHPLFLGGAGRLNVSAFAEAPRCPGPDTPDSVLTCFLASHKSNPTVDWSSTKTERLDADRVLFTWAARIPYNGRVYRQANANVLFARKGRWVDVHLSYIEPTDDDVEQLARMARTVKAADAAR